MAWTDRIQIAAYTSPSGTRFEFQYENVSMESDKKTGNFIFPEIDGEYIQDRGRGSRRFPLTLFFSGPDYDIESDAFFAALEEIGIGTLEHPLYGTRKVVPTGTIKRRDDLVTEANQSIFLIVFSETIIDINFPSSTVSDESDIRNSVDDLDDNITAQYATVVIASENENITLQNDLIEKKDIFQEILDALIGLNEDIRDSQYILNDSFNNGIGGLIFNPGGVISQGLILINGPSNVLTGFNAFIEGFGGVIDIYTGNTPDNEAIAETPNLYLNSLVFVAGCMGSLSLSMLNADFLSRPDAIEASEKINEIYDKITTWMDDNITEHGINDTGEIYASLNTVFSKISGYLIRLSFDLPKKIYITLKEDRQLIELVSELYGDLDRIDFFIQTNDLTTDEIELLPIGKEIIYFE